MPEEAARVAMPACPATPSSLRASGRSARVAQGARPPKRAAGCTAGGRRAAPSVSSVGGRPCCRPRSSPRAAAIRAHWQLRRGTETGGCTRPGVLAAGSSRAGGPAARAPQDRRRGRGRGPSISATNARGRRAARPLALVRAGATKQERQQFPSSQCVPLSPRGEWPAWWRASWRPSSGWSIGSCRSAPPLTRCNPGWTCVSRA